MGTRSVTVFKEEDGTAICEVYRQSDGYPSGHGIDLAKLCNVRLTNGISGDGVGTANGMGCLAALVIMGLKEAHKSKYHPTGVGGIYMQVPSDKHGADMVDYVYIVTGKTGEVPTIECIGYDSKSVFKCSADQVEQAVQESEDAE